MFKRNSRIGRRDLFKTSAGIMGGALLSREAPAEHAAQRNVNTNSRPSALKITDLRALASVHCAAATANFLACENHSLDVPWWDDLVEGIDKPIINKGFIKVPDKPSLGVTLNEDVVKRHLAPGTGYFEPTPQWDRERSGDWLWSMLQAHEASHRG